MTLTSNKSNDTSKMLFLLSSLSISLLCSPATIFNDNHYHEYPFIEHNYKENDNYKYNFHLYFNCANYLPLKYYSYHHPYDHYKPHQHCFLITSITALLPSNAHTRNREPQLHNKTHTERRNSTAHPSDKTKR